jgi:hypothetical protein
MQIRPISEANNRSDRQEDPCILQIEKVHYRINKSPTLVTILNLTASYFTSLRTMLAMAFLRLWQSRVAYSGSSRRLVLRKPDI